MSYTSKYNTFEERQTAHRIYRLKEKQNRLRKQWLELDIKIVSLKHKLKGKYKDIG